jgi:hypothetical protein
VNGYTTPATVKYTAADASKAVTMTYNTTIVTVNMADNQTAYNDIANATAEESSSPSKRNPAPSLSISL